MPPLVSYQHGIYPRSEAVVAATRDLDRGRTTPEAVEQAFRRDRDEVVALQRDARLDLVSDGLLRWQDVFRPLVEAADGMDARTLVRWFDNNSFFRAPEISGDARLDGRLPGVFDDGLAENAVVTLPSPYLFSRAAHVDGDRNAVLLRLATDVLSPVVRGVVECGARLVHLEEPWLPFFGADPDAWGPLEDGLAELRSAAGEATLVFHVYFGDAAPFADRLRRLPVDAVGIDFVETDVDALEGRWDTGLVVGCIDGRRSMLESVEGTVKFVQQVAERLRPPQVYVSSNSELELLPRDVADRKVRLLGEVGARAREALG